MNVGRQQIRAIPNAASVSSSVCSQRLSVPKRRWRRDHPLHIIALSATPAQAIRCATVPGRNLAVPSRHCYQRPQSTVAAVSEPAASQPPGATSWRNLMFVSILQLSRATGKCSPSVPLIHGRRWIYGSQCGSWAHWLSCTSPDTMCDWRRNQPSRLVTRDLTLQRHAWFIDAPRWPWLQMMGRSGRRPGSRPSRRRCVYS
jgi:hypothetical protein